MTAHAVVATKPWTVGYRPIELPEPEATDVVVRTHFSWISNGTEGSYVRGERIGGDTPWREGCPSPFPHIPGYQSTGVVTWVGAKIDHVVVGDRVFTSVGRVPAEMFFPYGGHMNPAVVRGENVWRLPGGVDMVEASGLVLTQVGVNAGTRPQIEPGQAAVVVGDGLVGHWSAQTLQARGARVMLVGRNDDRLAPFALQPGDLKINARETEPVGAAREWAPEGVQALIHTAGPVSAIEAQYVNLRRFAHVVSAGFVGTEGAMDVQKMRDSELTLHTIAGCTRERLDRTLDMLAHRQIATQHLITHRFPACRAEEAFDLLLHRRQPHLGIVLDWEEVSE